MKEVDPRKLQQMQQTPPKSEEMSIDKLVKFGILEKESEPVKGFKIMMHTISQEEKEKSNALIPDDSIVTIMQRQESLKRPTLVYAITKINKDVFETEQQKMELFAKLRTMQGSTVDLIYVEYQKLFIEQFEMLNDGVKKKS